MREEVEFILSRVHRHEDTRTGYVTRVEKWEKMYKLDAGFNRTLHQAIAEGQEQVILPTPFNVVNLSQRLLSSTPRIDVIPQDPTDKTSMDYAEICEKWLTAMWSEINWQNQTNVLADAIWDVLVRGRFAFEVKWIEDAVPKALRKEMLPFTIRTLNPKNVGIRRNPIFTEYAYHKSEEALLDVIREWPELLDSDVGQALRTKLDELEHNNDNTEEVTVCVIDYWETDAKTGVVRNAILVEDEFAKPLSETSYPFIPIICGRGDYALGLGDEYDGLSILHPLEGLWEYECRLVSQMATALLWHFWPAITVQNDEGAPVGDIDISPGITTSVPRGTRIDMHRIEPNVPLAQAVFDQIETYVQQATYDGVIYGNAGQLTSGYGISMMSEAAKGRIKNFQEGLEMALVHVHRLVLALVESKGGKKGVSIHTMNERNDERVSLTLNKQMIKGLRQNRVRISPVLPDDNAARVAMGMQMVDGGKISNQTFLDKFLDVDVPTDETMRVSLEELMKSDEMRVWRMRTVAQQYFKEAALDMLYETPFMPVPPQGKEWIRNDDGVVMLVDTAPAPTPSPAPTDMSSTSPLPPMAPGMEAGGPLQPEQAFPGPMGGSPIPPVMQGQLEGEALGLPQDVDPMLLDQILNTPQSPNAQLRMAAGLPPEGTIPGAV